MAYHLATHEQLMAMSDQEFSRQYSQLVEWLKKNKGHDLNPNPKLPRDRLTRAVIGFQTLYLEDFMTEDTLRGMAHWAKTKGKEEVVLRVFNGPPIF
jgi:hypothetical protein